MRGPTSTHTETSSREGMPVAVEVLRARPARPTSSKARTHQSTQHILEVSHHIGGVIWIWPVSPARAIPWGRSANGLADKDRASRTMCDVFFNICFFRVGIIVFIPRIMIEELMVARWSVGNMHARPWVALSRNLHNVRE